MNVDNTGQDAPGRNPARPANGVEKMRRFCSICVLLVAGCAGVEGPRFRLDCPKQVDDPRLTIEEQKRRERDQLALPDDSQSVGPPTYFTPPGVADPAAIRGH